MSVLKWNGKPFSERLKQAQFEVDTAVLRRCGPRVPFDSGELIRSGIRETKVGSGSVRYRTPYARRWYYEPARFQGAPTRGNYWFERMKREGGERAIRAIAAKYLQGK